jgi:restriction endonuclease S subunit
MQEWVDRITQPYNEKNTKQAQIKDLEMFVQNRIKEIGAKEPCDDVELGSVCDIQDGYEFNKNELTTCKNNIPLVRATYIENNVFSNYIIENNKFDKYKVNYGDIIMSQVGNVGEITKYNEIQFGYNKRNAFKITNKNINKNYLYNYLKTDEFKKKIISNGSIVQFISIPNLKKIKIKIPKNKQLIQDLEATFQQIETLQTEVKTVETLYKKLIQELSEEAMPNQPSEEQDQDQEETVSIPENKMVEPDNVIAEEPKKKMVKTKKPKVVEQSI